jgi:glycosyltransferase involved in cell wall biosynthesis
VLAYNCAPNRGSEHSFGFNLIKELASNDSRAEIHVFTRTEFKEEIQDAFQAYSNVTLNFNFEYELLLRKLKIPAMISFYLTYRIWEMNVFRKLQSYCAINSIELVHKLNIIAYEYLGNLHHLKGIKTIAGPLSGFEDMPKVFRRYLSFGDKVFYFIRSTLKKINKDKILKILNSGSISHLLVNDILLESKLAGANTYFFDSYCLSINANIKSDNNSAEHKIKVLLAARWVSRKGYSFLNSVLDKIDNTRIEFCICNDGPFKKIFLERLNKFGFDYCDYGILNSNDLNNLMSECDFLCYPSFLDANTNLIPQALDNSLPVLAFKRNSYSRFLKNNISLLLDIDGLSNSEIENLFVQSINSLASDREQILFYRKNIPDFVNTMSYSNAASQLLSIYKKVINGL